MELVFDILNVHPKYRTYMRRSIPFILSRTPNLLRECRAELLAQFCQPCSQLPDAIAAYQQAVKLDPKYSRAYLRLAVDLSSVDQKQASHDALQAVISIDPKSSDADVAKRLL